MELFGIIFSVPVAFTMSMVYCAFLAKLMRKFERVHRAIRRDKGTLYGFKARARGADLMRSRVYTGSLVILGCFLIELVLLFKLGAVRSRAVLGPGFYGAHVVFFFLGAPALANVLILRERGLFVTRWYLAAIICTIVAFFLVILQYSVSEELYGFEGNPGPFGNCTLIEGRPLR
jgi:hypothetical protein